MADDNKHVLSHIDFNGDSIDIQDAIARQAVSEVSNEIAELAKNAVTNVAQGISDYTIRVTKDGLAIDVPIKGLSSKLDELAQAIDGKASSTHTHTKSQITDFPTKVSSFQNGSNYQTDRDVTNAIDDIQIGGRNMCIGTNQGIRNWGWSMRTGTYTKEEVLEDGIRTCKMTRGDDAQSGWTVIYFYDISRDKWLPDTDYIITVEVKSNVNTTFILYGLAASDGTGNLRSKIDVVNNKTNSGE